MDMSHMWLFVPLGWSAVWRIRTSKSFPTDWLATSSNTIMGIRLSASQYTAIYQEAYLLKEGVSNATLGELVEWDTNSRTQRDWFTVSLLCPLAYPPMPEVRFCWTITSHKTGSVIFHVCTHYYAHVRIQLVTASSPQRYWVEFHRMPKNGIEPFPVSLVVARFWPLFPMSYIDLTAIWRLATIFIVPCVALGFIVFAD